MRREKRKERTYLFLVLLLPLFNELALDISRGTERILILEMRGCPPTISGGRTTRTTPHGPVLFSLEQQRTSQIRTPGRD